MYKTNTIGEKTTKLTRTKVENDQLGCLLKSPIFVLQKASTPKNGVELSPKSIGVIRCSLATLYDDVQRCATSKTSPKVFCHKQTDIQTEKQTKPRIEMVPT